MWNFLLDMVSDDGVPDFVVKGPNIFTYEYDITSIFVGILIGIVLGFLLSRFWQYCKKVYNEPLPFESSEAKKEEQDQPQEPPKSGE